MVIAVIVVEIVIVAALVLVVAAVMEVITILPLTPKIKRPVNASSTHLLSSATVYFHPQMTRKNSF